MTVEADLLEQAWKVIIAVGEGDWSAQSTKWQYDAEKWRLEYFSLREVSPPLPPPVVAVRRARRRHWWGS